jgi:hypothetical protein
MLSRRRTKVILGLLLALAAVSVSVSYALYARSAAYRRITEKRLAERLGMSVSIGGIQSLTEGSSQLTDVHVYLEDEGLEVFSCATAVWSATPHSHGTKPGPRSATAQEWPDSYVLHLSDGWLVVGTTAWTQAEYERMLEGGLGHNFTALGLTEIRFRDIDLRFKHPVTEFTAGDAAGVIRFDERGDGIASLNCFRLNDIQIAQPARITLEFTPGDRLIFHEVRLAVPRMPLDALGLGRLFGSEVPRGQFHGTITYQLTGGRETVDISGSVREANLDAFTGQLTGGPYQGTIDIDLKSLGFTDRKLTTLAGQGQIADLRLGHLVPGLISAVVGEGLDLQIDRVHWTEGKLAHLSASGGCPNLSLDALSAIWGEGTITGHGALEIRSLEVLSDQLRAADMTVLAVAPENAPGLIDRALIVRMARAWFGIDVGAALPEHIEYTQFGARLLVQDGRLRILGTHGPDGRTILTVRLFGRPVGILRQPERDFPVPDVIGWLRQRAGELDTEQIRDWWEELRERNDRTP